MVLDRREVEKATRQIVRARVIDQEQVLPHRERADGTFSRSDFKFDPGTDAYTCPGGKLLKRNLRPFKVQRTGITKANTIIYRASQLDCQGCQMKARCCPNTASRKIARQVHEAARDEARRISRSPEYEQSQKDRKKVEVLFGHMKRILKMDRLRLRGLSGAKDEFMLTATAQTLRRLAQ